MDFGLSGGWHVTLSDPRTLAAIVVVAALLVVLLTKMLMAH
ncbi:MAG TPA: hypothetical protein VL484_20405 [Vicinamibacterales bacterium]|jgi:hypothetical protein|nr:hypothetical protein [Vicinamibacterales bacterium]